MVEKFHFTFEAGGYPNPRYNGEKTFEMNIDPNEKQIDVMERAMDRARKIVMDAGCFSATQVRIIKLKVV